MNKEKKMLQATICLKRIIKKELFTDKETCFKYSYDNMNISFMPQAVIKITKEWQVGKILRLANKFKISITIRGSGSTSTGSATPLTGGWVIDLSNMNHIKIDAINSMAYVEAGAITNQIQKKSKLNNLFYPPDPASSMFCTIGGNIACNAGGLRCVKYGVTRDYVIALRGYLPTGENVSWGRPLKKFTVGYNLRDLWIGAEGTLGVITHAVLKLIKQPSSRWTCLSAFSNEKNAIKTAHAILNMNNIPSALEFLDCLTVSGIEKQIFKEMIPNMFDETCFLLIEFDNTKEEIQNNEFKIINSINKNSGIYYLTKDEEETNKLWIIRKQCSKAMFKHGDTKLNEDVVVSIDKINDLIDFIKKISINNNLKIPIFGHIGDGNLHVNIMYNSNDLIQEKKAIYALNQIMQQVVHLGGAITGEHGVGLSKSIYLPLQYNKIEINTMMKIKKTLDPKCILNPKKIFSAFSPWKYKKLSKDIN